MSMSPQSLRRPNLFCLSFASFAALLCYFGLGFAADIVFDRESLKVPPILHENLLEGKAVLAVYKGRLIGMDVVELLEHFGEGQSGDCVDFSGKTFETRTYRLGTMPDNPCECVRFILRKGKVCSYDVLVTGWAVYSCKTE